MKKQIVALMCVTLVVLGTTQAGRLAITESWQKLPYCLAVVTSDPRELANRLYRIWFTDNFYEVQAGALYRSAQLSCKNLQKYIDAHGIKTILNLRNEDANHQVIAAEQECAQKNNCNFVHVPLLAAEYPSPESVQKILAVLHDPQAYPLLVHCSAGMDRTGACVGLYALEKGASLDVALAQQSYGHIERMYPKMKEFVRVWYECKNNASASTSALAYYQAWYAKVMAGNYASVAS